LTFSQALLLLDEFSPTISIGKYTASTSVKNLQNVAEEFVLMCWILISQLGHDQILSGSAHHAHHGQMQRP
jgi:hypothetical protein